jgi:hypothetical protein
MPPLACGANGWKRSRRFQLQQQIPRRRVAGGGAVAQLGLDACEPLRDGLAGGKFRTGQVLGRCRRRTGQNNQGEKNPRRTP